MELISKGLQYIDIFQQTLKMKFRLSTEYKTNIGGVISTLVIVLFILISIVLLKDIIGKSNQSLLITPVTQEVPLDLYFNNTETTMFRNDSSVFFYSFYFFNNTSKLPLDYSIIQKTLFFELVLINRFFATGKSNNVAFYKLVNCKDFYGDNFPSYGYDNKYLMCLNSTSFQIKGDFFSPEYRYMSMKFKKCDQAANENRIYCYGNDLITRNIKQIGLTLIYTNMQLDPAKHSNEIPVKLTPKTFTVFPSNTVRLNYDIFITRHKIKGFENLLTKYENPEEFYFPAVSKIVPGFALLDKNNI